MIREPGAFLWRKPQTLRERGDTFERTQEGQPTPLRCIMMLESRVADDLASSLSNVGQLCVASSFPSDVVSWRGLLLFTMVRWGIEVFHFATFRKVLSSELLRPARILRVLGQGAFPSPGKEIRNRIPIRVWATEQFRHCFTLGRNGNPPRSIALQACTALYD